MKVASDADGNLTAGLVISMGLGEGRELVGSLTTGLVITMGLGEGREQVGLFVGVRMARHGR